MQNCLQIFRLDLTDLKILHNRIKELKKDIKSRRFLAIFLSIIIIINNINNIKIPTGRILLTLPSSVSIGHHSWEISKTASSVYTDLMRVSFSSSANIGLFMCASSWKRSLMSSPIASPAGSNVFCSSYLDGF